jgi:hypothetical protein
MNIYTHDIAALLKVSLEVAREVQTLMEYNDFDFSESSTSQFNREAKLRFKEIQLPAKTNG